MYSRCNLVICWRVVTSTPMGRDADQRVAVVAQRTGLDVVLASHAIQLEGDQRPRRLASRLVAFGGGVVAVGCTAGVATGPGVILVCREALVAGASAAYAGYTLIDVAVNPLHED